MLHTKAKKKGMVEIALLIFLMAFAALMIASAVEVLSGHIALSTHDFGKRVAAEKDGVSQVVAEAIFSQAEFIPSNSSLTLQAEIDNRLLAIASTTSGLTIAADPVPSLPVLRQFPDSLLPAASVQPVAAGLGADLNAFLSRGPAVDLTGTPLSFTFTRSNSDAPSEAQTYTVNASMYAFPVTNTNLVAYGLPASKFVPASAPAIPPGTLAVGATTQVVTMNDPVQDSTAYDDLIANGVTDLPYYYRNGVSYSWNAYEAIFSTAYQNSLAAGAGASNTIDYGSGVTPGITGVTYSGAGNTEITIDLAAVTSQCIAVIDPLGTSSITITGSSTAGSPVMLVVRNLSYPLVKTDITISSQNARPILLLGTGINVLFSGNHTFAGGFIIDPTSSMSGTVQIIGHLSFYSGATPFPGLNATITNSSTVAASLSAIAPRALLVAARPQ